MEESSEFSLCGGESKHICISCPKYMFTEGFYSNMSLYNTDTALPIQKKNNILKLIMSQTLIFHFPLLGRPSALVTMSPPGQGSEGSVKNGMLIHTSLGINLSQF